MNEVELFRATVRGVPDAIVYASSSGAWWVSLVQIEGRSTHDEHRVTNRVPLRVVDESKVVVIDPEDLEVVRDFYWNRSSSDLQEFIRGLLKPVPPPPIPPAPTGEYVVVDKRGSAWLPEEISDSDGWEWVWQNHGPLTIYLKEES